MRWTFYKWIKIIILLSVGVCVYYVFVKNPRENAEKVYGAFHSPVLFDDLVESHDMRYKIWYNVWQPSKPAAGRICIITQTSIHHMHYLIRLVETWNSDICVAVFVPGRGFDTFIKILKTLVECYPKIAYLVTVHAVIPLSHPPDQKLLSIDSWSGKKICSVINENANIQNYGSGNIPYPVNLLRNVALKHPSNYVLVIDIDMLPNKQLESQVFESSLLKQNSSVVVIPAFETKKNLDVPDSKDDLIELWNFGKIRPFYEKVCWKCQKYTDYEKWKSSMESSLSYEIDWHDPWEPFYVAHKKHVIYDERFEQYGFNRISQLCHLHMAGYHFHVLQNSFLIHDGFKEAGKFHSSKNEENRRNKILYQRMKYELQRKYEGSLREC